MIAFKKAVEVGQLPATVPEQADRHDQQHQHDLQVLGRIEEERLCFFCSMERLHAEQRRGAGR